MPLGRTSRICESFCNHCGIPSFLGEPRLWLALILRLALYFTLVRRR